MITYSYTQMFPCTHHRSDIWLNAALHTAACLAYASVCETLRCTHPADQILTSFEIALAVFCWFEGFLRILTHLNSFLGWFGVAEAWKEWQNISFRMSMRTASWLNDNQVAKGVQGTFDSVIGTEVLAYRLFLASNDLVLWSNTPQ